MDAPSARHRGTVAAGLLGGVALLATGWTALVLRGGIIVTPDGWEYWEGAASILRGCGYTYFGGQPIRVYPPLYAYALAGVQWIFGVSAGALVLGTALMAGISAAAWSALFMLLNPDWRRVLPLSVVVFAYCVVRSVSTHQALLSETLFLPLLAFALMALARVRPPVVPGRPSPGPLALVALSTLLMLMCRHASAAFVPGLALVTWWRLGRRGWALHGVATAFTFALPVIVWHAYRVRGGQLVQHPAFKQPKYDALTYLDQLARGIPAEFGAGPWGWVLCGIVVGLLIWVSVVELRSSDSSAPSSRWLDAMDVIVVAVLSVGATFVLFNLTWIADALSGRFIWWLPSSLVIALATAAALRPEPRLRMAAVGAIALMSLVPSSAPWAEREAYRVPHGESIRPEERGLWPLVGEPVEAREPDHAWIDQRRGGKRSRLRAVKGCTGPRLRVVPRPRRP
jgi:hypothetical protein